MEASVFVFRTSEDREWHYKEMKEGRLRQGWGSMGTSLKKANQVIPEDDWIPKLKNEERDDSECCNIYRKLIPMLDMKAGDVVVVPKMPDRSSFIICIVSGGYSFDTDETVNNLSWDDFRHVIPIDPKSIKRFPHHGSLDTLEVHKNLRAYRYPINRVLVDRFRKTILKLQEGPEPPESLDLEDIVQRMRNNAANDMLSSIRRMPPERFEKLIGKLLIKAGYEVVGTHHYDSKGGDADIIVTHDMPLISDVLDITRTLIVQIKQKEGIDKDDIGGVNQLLLISKDFPGATRVLISTADKFTDECIQFAKEKDVLLISGCDISGLVLKYL